MKNLLVLLFLIYTSSIVAQTWNRLSSIQDGSGGITSSPMQPNIVIYNNSIRSTDRGVTWDSMRTNSYTNPSFLTWYSGQGETVYFGAIDGKARVVIMSTNAGETFVRTSFPPVHRLYNRNSPSRFLGLEIVNAGSAWNPSVHRIWTSRDDGQTWKYWTVSYSSNFTSGGTDDPSCVPSWYQSRYFAIDPIAQETAYQYIAGKEDGMDMVYHEKISMSTTFTDSGSFTVLPSSDYSGWNTMRTGFELLLFDIDPNNTNRIIVCGKNLMRSSSDAGTTWLQRNFPFTNSTSAAIDWSQNTLLVAGDSGIFRTVDFGQSWQNMSTGLNSLNVRSVHFSSDGNWYAATDEGFYNFGEKVTSINASTVFGFSLDQNYPNPVSTSTTIKYTIPIRSHVKIEIFDALGVNVITLVDQEFEPGIYNVTWNVRDTESKIYFYRMTAGRFVETKKFIMLK